MRDACSPDITRIKNEVLEDLNRIPSPRIGYIGNVDESFDEVLFYNLVGMNPDLSFVFIGPVKQGMLTKRYSNLFILSREHFENIDSYTANLNLGIIPIKCDEEYTINYSPMDLYKYIPHGIPVVATLIPELFLDLPKCLFM